MATTMRLAAIDIDRSGQRVYGIHYLFSWNQMMQLGSQSEEILDKVDHHGETIPRSLHFRAFRNQRNRSRQSRSKREVSNVVENGGKIVAAVITAVANFLRDVTLIPLFVFFFLYFPGFSLNFSPCFFGGKQNH